MTSPLNREELEKALLGFKGGYGNQSLSSIWSLIDQYAQQVAVKAVRTDRKANAQFWKDKIDDMFDKEITTYELLEKERTQESSIYSKGGDNQNQ